MADDKDETPVEGTDNGPSDNAKATLKGLIRETFDEWLADNQPAPKKTVKKSNILNDILGFGG